MVARIPDLVRVTSPAAPDLRQVAIALIAVGEVNAFTVVRPGKTTANGGESQKTDLR